MKRTKLVAALTALMCSAMMFSFGAIAASADDTSSAAEGDASSAAEGEAATESVADAAAPEAEVKTTEDASSEEPGGGPDSASDATENAKSGAVAGVGLAISAIACAAMVVSKRKD